MNQEFYPARLLSRLSNERNSGHLQASQGSVTWNVAVCSGELLFANCSTQSLAQLEYQLSRLGQKSIAILLRALSETALESWSRASETSAHLSVVQKAIHWLQAQALLDSDSLLQLSHEFTKEAIESLLWVTSGRYQWHENMQISLEEENSVTKLRFQELLELYGKRLQLWQRFNAFIQSPHQRPYVANQKFLEQPIPGSPLTPVVFGKIAQLMRGASIRQLAHILRQDELKVVQLLTPYIQYGAVCLREPAKPFQGLPTIPTTYRAASPEAPVEKDAINTQTTYQVACIDDSPTILDEIQRFLGDGGQFQLTKIDDPIKAPSIVFRLKPDLILMDITMPGVNGYKLCSLFRSSTVLEKTPIIMVTGNKGLIDKARAKMVGATDYLTKPFDQEALLSIVLRYLT
jgi:two-component system, chemotaxis family, response regulator PixG